MNNYIGQSVLRKEDGRLLRGRGKYLADLVVDPQTKHVAFWRSPYAHARIKTINVESARKLPGVVAILTGEDFSSVKPIRMDIALDGYAAQPQDPVAKEKVNYAGEIVAVVVADDRYVAEDALELIEIRFEPLPAVTNVLKALEPEAPLVHEEVKGNVFYREKKILGDESLDDVFAHADFVVADTFKTSRITGTPLETRGCIGSYDVRRNSLSLWSSTQIPSIVHLKLAEIFGMPENNLRIMTPDIGGGFGVKAQIYPEEIAVAFLAKQLGVTVKWVQDRREDLLTGIHAREHQYDLEAAVSKDGIITALRVKMLTDAGAYSSFPFGCTLEATGGARMILGPYRIRNYQYETVAVVTNKAPGGAYRGVAQPSCFLAIEGLMDQIADRLGMDPAELRRRNMLTSSELPYTNPIGIHFDSGSYHETLEKALELGSYTEMRSRQAEAPQSSTSQIGIGLACYTEITGISSKGYKGRGVMDVPGYDSVRMRMDPSGTVSIYTTLSSQGQGHETTLAQIAATELGIGLDKVQVIEGDTGLAPLGTGTFASRTSITGAGAVHRAARELRQRLLDIAGEMLDAPEDQLLLGGEHIMVRDREDSLPLSTVLREAYGLGTGGSESGNIQGLEVISYYDPPPANWSNATHLAVIELDRTTGAIVFLDYVVVSDCGRIINPLIVDGQIQGGVAQGIGEALLEALHYDSNGQLLTATWGDYLIPSALDVPNQQIDHIETPCPSTEGGYKGMGEGGAIGALPAVINAINDALKRSENWSGQFITQVPVTPEVILRHLGVFGGRSENS